MAGKLIVLEGIDGSGTTTQTKKLLTALSGRGFRVASSAEPTGSALGSEIRRLLSLPIEKEPAMLASLALCFAADRMQHVHNTIAPHLKEYEFLVLDRYLLSSMVYQGLHLPTSFIRAINQFAIKPNLTVVLDLDAKIAYERLSTRAKSKDFYESLSLLQKIRNRYLHFVKDDSNTVLVDASGDIDQVHSHIMHAIELRF